MPRKYDRTIRYYDSWFADLTDPSKEFTAEECWQVMLAIRECQLQGTLAPLEQLPLSIRRALSMATMGEQITRQLERIESRRDASRKGGEETRNRRRSEDEIAAAKIRLEREEQEQAQRDAKHEEDKLHAVTREQYLELKRRAAEGDEVARKKLGI